MSPGSRLGYIVCGPKQSVLWGQRRMRTFAVLRASASTLHEAGGYGEFLKRGED